jgi:aspartyl protease family protein
MGSGARHLLHEALVWCAAALLCGVLIYFFNDIRTALIPATGDGTPRADLARGEPSPDTSRPGFAREVRLRADRRGHFLVEASINGRPAKFMADTGATLVVLAYEDAERLGLSPHSLDFSAKVETANGIARVAPVTLDRVRIDDIAVRDVPALVAERGALATNLLGMSFLGRLKSFQIEHGELVLTQ